MAHLLISTYLAIIQRNKLINIFNVYSWSTIFLVFIFLQRKLFFFLAILIFNNFFLLFCIFVFFIFGFVFTWSLTRFRTGFLILILILILNFLKNFLTNPYTMIHLKSKLLILFFLFNFRLIYMKVLIPNYNNVY